MLRAWHSAGEEADVAVPATAGAGAASWRIGAMTEYEHEEIQLRFHPYWEPPFQPHRYDSFDSVAQLVGHCGHYGFCCQC